MNKSEIIVIESDTVQASRIQKVYTSFRNSIIIQEAVFFSQILFIIIILIISIYNLCIDDPKTSLWTALLTSTCSYLIPPPRLNRGTKNGDG